MKRRDRERQRQRQRQRQTHTCECLVPESRSDLLLSLLCHWQSGVCIVLFVWRCLHCDSHVKVRLTETETETETE